MKKRASSDTDSSKIRRRNNRIRNLIPHQIDNQPSILIEMAVIDSLRYHLKVNKNDAYSIVLKLVFKMLNLNKNILLEKIKNKPIHIKISYFKEFKWLVPQIKVDLISTCKVFLLSELTDLVALRALENELGNKKRRKK